MTMVAIPDTLMLTDTREKLEEIGELAILVAESSAEFRQELASLAVTCANAHPNPERLLTILYMRTQESLQNSAVSAHDLVRRVKRALRTFDPGTLRELVANAEARIPKSRFLMRKYALARQEIDDLTPDFERLAQQLVPQLNDTLLQRDPTESVDEEAWGCSLNGTRISCWLALAIAIVAILVV